MDPYIWVVARVISNCLKYLRKIKIPFFSFMPAAKLNRSGNLLFDNFHSNWLLCVLPQALSTWHDPCSYQGWVQPLILGDPVTIWYHSHIVNCWKIDYLCLRLNCVAETLSSEMQPWFNRTTIAAFPFLTQVHSRSFSITGLPTVKASFSLVPFITISLNSSCVSGKMSFR